jgi:ABC-2 type transport system permease protein
MVPIYKKEMRNYFSQMIGYLFLAFFLLITGIYFVVSCVASQSSAFYQVLSGTTIIFFILVPALTMRLFSEESRHKTDQLLFTSPLSVGEIVIGKFLAAVSLFLIAIAVSFIMPIMLSQYGILPLSQIASAYLGYFLLGMTFISVGLFVSVLTNNQIIAAVGTFAVVFALFIMDAITSVMPTDTLSSMIFVAALIIAVAGVFYSGTRNVVASLIVGGVGVVTAVVLYLVNSLAFDGAIVKVLQWFSVYARFGDMANGVLNLSDVVYYLAFTVLFIYLTVNVIEKRRWR